MKFIHKLLLSAAIVIGFVTAGFANPAESTIVGKSGSYEVWVSKDGKNIWATTDNQHGLFGITKRVGGDLSDGRFALFFPNNPLNGVKTVYYTVDGGITFVKEQVTFTNGFANVTTLIKKYELGDFTAATQIAFAVDGQVVVFNNDGFLGAVKIMEDYNPNPFGGGNDNPFAPKTTQTYQGWVVEFGVEYLNPFALKEYIGIFVADAKQNFGLDFSYIYDYEVNIKFDSQDEHILKSPRTIAYTNALGNDKKVNIVVNPTAWLDASPAKRLAIIYHELGHDILNLDHKAEKGPLMSKYAREDFSFEDLYELRIEMFNDYKSN